MNKGRCPGRQMPFSIPAGAVLLTTIFLLWGTGTSPARDEEPQQAVQEELSAEEQAAVIQYLARFRFGADLKVGDWVRYSYTNGPDSARQIELKVAGREEDALWIVETLTCGAAVSSVQLLANPAQQSFSQLYVIDESGEKKALPVLRIDQYYTTAADMITRAAEEGDMPPFTWRKAEDRKEITVAGGSFTCGYLEPDIDEEEQDEVSLKKEAADRLGLGRLKDLASKPEDLGDLMDLKDNVESLKDLDGLKGLVDVPDLDDLEEIVELLATRPSKGPKLEKTPMYFSEQVPRLIPYEIALGFFMFPGTLSEVDGGLVQFGRLELESYGTGE